jgi:hypothetical protein
MYWVYPFKVFSVRRSQHKVLNQSNENPCTWVSSSPRGKWTKAGPGSVTCNRVTSSALIESTANSTLEGLPSFG